MNITEIKIKRNKIKKPNIYYKFKNYQFKYNTESLPGPGG
jgi:hypothetical protein